MKTLQEQFYENALQGKEFTLAVENGETLHYVSTQNRDLTLYYEYRERDRNTSYWTALYDVKNISLIAIVVGDRVLIVDRYRDPILFEEKAYPDNMYDIDTYKEEIEKKIQEILKMEYEELPVEVIDEDSEIYDSIHQEARKCVFSGKEYTEETLSVNFSVDLDYDDLFSIAKGNLTIDEKANELFEKDKYLYRAQKMKNQTIEKLIASDTLLDDHERQILSLKEKVLSLDSYVSVTFEQLGNTGTGQVKLQTLINQVESGKNFDYFDFVSNAKGKELLFSELKCHLYGAKPNWRNISEIKYRGKVIYQR